MLVAILQIVKDGERKSVAFQVLAMNLLRRNVVQNERKRPCPEMHGFCNFAVFVDEKSRALEPWGVQNIQKGSLVQELQIEKHRCKPAGPGQRRRHDAVCGGGWCVRVGTGLPGSSYPRALVY